jgi:hypothetical protein
MHFRKKRLIVSKQVAVFPCDVEFTDGLWVVDVSGSSAYRYLMLKSTMEHVSWKGQYITTLDDHECYLVIDLTEMRDWSPGMAIFKEELEFQ